MNYKNFSLFAIVAIAFLVLVNYYASRDSTKELDKADNVKTIPRVTSSSSDFTAAQVATPTSTVVQQSSNPNDAHLENRLNILRERRPEQTFDPAEVAAAMKRTVAWESAKSIPTHLPLTSEELTDGRQFIRFDTLKLESLIPGDAFQVTIDDVRRDYEIVIDKVEKNLYGNVSWLGHIEGDDGQTYSVSFTRGKQLTVSSVDTPEGHYMLQAHGSDGWIASSRSLFKIAPEESDVISPQNVKTKTTP